MLKMVLNQFTMSYKGYPECPVGVPCSLLDTLYKNGWMEDPYYQDNAKHMEHIPDDVCSFKTSFEVNENFLKYEKMELVCDGLDTLCSVRVNGTEIGYADNMHRTWKFDLSGVLCQGENTVEFRFFPPTAYIQERQKRHYAWGDTHAIDGIAHIRKASCMFGWDWGPKLPDTGIFREVHLRAYDLPVLENLLVLQEHRNGAVLLRVESQVQGQLSPDHWFRLELESPAGEVFEEISRDGRFQLELQKPMLWWPNGYGKQPLYRVKVGLFCRTELLTEGQKTIGLRTLTVSRERDQWGREFCFEVNGKKIFAMGADYIPQDNILPRVTLQRMEELVLSCVQANFNCLRIWGGGYYPSDEFYDLCDRYGLIIWQDFMFACLNVWMNRNFEENVRQEIQDVLLRIRHHACIGLLCGNNEMELAMCEWKFMPRDALVKADYLRLYERMMPDLCEEYAPHIFYWPSSPSCGGGFADPNDENNGDTHYWEVWLRNAPVENYDKLYFRFCSEFGFESFPDRKTVRYYTGGQGENALSDIIEFHQKREQASVKLVTYAADHYLYAATFDQFIYTTQLVQARAIQYAVEHMRRFRGRCMGAIYWQLNDCWPGQTWSSVDYFGRWKALHYFAKRFFARQTVWVHRYGEQLVVVASNEGLEPFEGFCTIRVKNNRFDVLLESRVDFELAPLSAKDLSVLNFESVLGPRANDTFLEYVWYSKDGERIAGRAYVGVKDKFYHYADPQITSRLEKCEDGYLLRLNAKAFARDVEISSDRYDFRAEDNYIDITDSGTYQVKLLAAGIEDDADFEKSLTIRCVYDIGR